MNRIPHWDAATVRSSTEQLFKPVAAFKVSEKSPMMSLLVGPISLANQRCAKCASCSFKIRSYDSNSRCSSRAKPMKRCLVTVEMREQDVWPGPGDKLFIYYNENDHLVRRDNDPRESSSDLKDAEYYYTCTGYECSKFFYEHQNSQLKGRRSLPKNSIVCYYTVVKFYEVRFVISFLPWPVTSYSRMRARIR
jgi:hypothetical protein